jgi:hypothetical protein
VRLAVRRTASNAQPQPSVLRDSWLSDSWGWEFCSHCHGCSPAAWSATSGVGVATLATEGTTRAPRRCAPVAVTAAVRRAVATCDAATAGCADTVVCMLISRFASNNGLLCENDGAWTPLVAPSCLFKSRETSHFGHHDTIPGNTRSGVPHRSSTSIPWVYTR